MSRRAEGGFTLIELIVGLALFGLIVAVLTGALRVGLVGSDRVDEGAQRLNELRLAQTFIRRHLETARPIVWPMRRTAPLAFEGKSESVSFISILPSWPGQGGLYLVRFARIGDALIVTRRITSGEEQAFDFSRHADHTVLTDGIREVRFTYFGADIKDKKPKWRTSWTARTTFPRLVRLQVDFN